MQKAGEDELVSVAALDNWAQLAFEGTKKLNRIQSMVYETAYLSGENMLVCAPTGMPIPCSTLLVSLSYPLLTLSYSDLQALEDQHCYVAPNLTPPYHYPSYPYLTPI